MTDIGSLHIIPSPFEDELPTSWVIRIAEMHAVTVSELFRAMMLRGASDPDIAFSRKHINRLTKGTLGDYGNAYANSELFRSLRKQSWLKVWLRKDSHGKSTVGFCPECLANDTEPYFRGVWRFRFWVLCDKHNRRMLDACTFCGAPVQLKPFIFHAPWKGPGRRLATCRACTKPLHWAFPAEDEICQERASALIALQRVITAALIYGKYQLIGMSGWLPLEFLPSFLLRGVVGANKETKQELDPILIRTIRSAKRRFIRTGDKGFYPKAVGDQVLDLLLDVWQGDAGKLAELVIQKRFSQDTLVLEKCELN